MSARRLLRGVLRRCGYDLVGFTAASHPIARLRALFRHLGIDLVLDVGANAGQYARFLRQDVGYRGRIESFEPQPDVYPRLVAASRGDGLWRTHPFALGAAEGELPFNVAPNRVASSFLPATALLRGQLPEACGSHRISVPVRTLDGVLPTLSGPSDRIWLKIDTQGYERQVLIGGERALAGIVGGQLEVALRASYQGAAELPELLPLLAAVGLLPVGVEAGYGNPRTGEVYEAELFFARPLDTLPARGAG